MFIFTVYNIITYTLCCADHIVYIHHIVYYKIIYFYVYMYTCTHTHK